MAGLEGARLCGGSKKRQKQGGIRKEKGNLAMMETNCKGTWLGLMSNYFGVLLRSHFSALQRRNHLGALSKLFFGALSKAGY